MMLSGMNKIFAQESLVGDAEWTERRVECAEAFVIERGFASLHRQSMNPSAEIWYRKRSMLSRVTIMEGQWSLPPESGNTSMPERGTEVFDLEAARVVA
jgi:hypothetical protein